MPANPYQSPTELRADTDAEMFLRYPVDRKRLAQEAKLYLTSRLEIIGALSGLALLFVFCIAATLLQHQRAVWWMELRDSGGLMFGLAVLAVTVAVVVPFIRRRMRKRILARTHGTVLDEVGVRTLTVSTDRLMLEINGRQWQLPMKDVHFIDRKSKFRAIRHTVLRLNKRLPLAIPDTAEFANVHRDEFLRQLKKRCGNVCLF